MDAAAMKTLGKRNHFTTLCGIQMLEAADGSLYAQAEIVPDHHNPYGVVHGGMFYTMADNAGGANACLLMQHPVTLNSSFQYLRNVSSGIVTARCTVVRSGRTILVLRVEITSDTGLLLAEGEFTYYNVG